MDAKSIISGTALPIGISSKEDVTWLFTPKYAFFFSFCAPERLPPGPVRTRLHVNLCTHLTSGPPKKCKTSHLKRLYCDYWACERRRLTAGRYFILYIPQIYVYLSVPVFSVQAWALHRSEGWPERIQPLLTTSNYFNFLVLRTDSESSKPEVWQAGVKVSMLEWGTQS